jgi:hypothetical protein
MGSLWANSSRLGVQKILQKSEKKACQVSESSINEEKLADKPADFPFKNILKKVKKKLVRLKKIQ